MGVENVAKLKWIYFRDDQNKNITLESIELIRFSSCTTPSEENFSVGHQLLLMKGCKKNQSSN